MNLKFLFLSLLFYFSPSKGNTQTWTQLPNLPFQSVVDTAWNSKYGCGFVIGSNIYFLPADTAQLWCYNTLTSNWTRKAVFPLGLRVNACSFTIEPYGYITCGRSYGSIPGQKNDLWQYNPATDSWTQKSNITLATREYALAFVVNGKAYVGSGASAAAPPLAPYSPSMREYNPTTDTWTSKAQIPDVNNPPFKDNGRGMATAFAFGGFGYVLNGIGNGSLLTDTRQYNPLTNTWANLTPAFGNNIGGTGISNTNRGFICFGQAGTSLTSYNLIWQLDSTLTWTPKSNFPGPSRKFAAGYTVGCNTYIIGGQNHSASNVPPNTNLNDFWKSECNTLPIALLDFEANCLANENPSILVNWHTANENNAKSFILRLETDDEILVKEIAAKGNSNQVSSYHTSFSISKSVGLNPALLSLIELDLDGNYTTILTESISCQLSPSAILSVYPNPISGGEFMLQYSSINPKLIKIIDAVGHELNFSYTYLNQNLHIRLEANNLPGLYYLLYQGAFIKIVLLP